MNLEKNPNQLTLNCAIQGIDHAAAGRIIQSADAPEAETKERYYFETVGAQAFRPNKLYAQFSDACLQMMAEQYGRNEPIMVLHNRMGDLPIGQSTTAGVVDGELIIQAYIRRGWQTAIGIPTDQIIEGINDSCINSVSVSVQIIEAHCSICGGVLWQNCYHYPGGKYSVKDLNGVAQDVVAIRHVEQAFVLELSIVAVGADPTARIFGSEDVVESDQENQLSNALEAHNTEKEEAEMPTIDELQSQTRTLEAQLSASNTEKEASQTQVGALTTQVETLTASVAALTTDKETLTAQLNEAKTLSAKAEELQTELDAFLSEERKAAMELYDAAYPEASEAEQTANKELVDNMNSVKQIRTMSASWKTIADEKYPTGRQTRESGGGQSTDKPQVRTAGPGNARRY